MAGYEEVAKAVIERWKPVLLNWEMLWFPRTAYPLQCVRLKPDPSKHVGYEETPATWYLRAELHVDASDEEVAYQRLSELTNQYGPLISRLLDDEPDHDALWDLCGLAIGVPDGKGWKPVNRHGRLSCDIGLELGTG